MPIRPVPATTCAAKARPRRSSRRRHSTGRSFARASIFGPEDSFLNLFARICEAVAGHCARRVRHALPARLRGRCRACMAQALGGRSGARAQLRPVRPGDLHAARTGSLCGGSERRGAPDHPARPTPVETAGRGARNAAGTADEPRQSGIDGEGQRMRLSVSCCVRHDAGGAGGGRSRIPGACRDAQSVTTHYRAGSGR